MLYLLVTMPRTAIIIVQMMQITNIHKDHPMLDNKEVRNLFKWP